MKNPKTIAEAIAQGLKAGDKINIPFIVTSIGENSIKVLNEQLNHEIEININCQLDPPPPPIDLKRIVYYHEGRRHEINFTTSETPKDGK